MANTLKYLAIILLLLAWTSVEIRAEEVYSSDSSSSDSTSLPLNSLYTDDYRIYSENNGSLFLSIDNISFFRNVETDGDIYKGYTLPGFRLTPRVILFPTAMIKLEAGLSLLKFWGTNQYPCYAYHDIADWKADNYQYGFHALPFFRAQIQPAKQINIVLGSIYGGSNHEIIEPLYNSELNFTADPESGVQFLYRSKIAKADVWSSWDSFIFENDTHQEALTFGTTAALNITPENSFFHMSLPAQFIGIHRGGELYTTESKLTTMNTMYNATTGLKFQFNTNRLLKNISLETMGATYKCNDNCTKLAYTDGWALYANLTAQIWYMKIKTAWWRSEDFINLFGNPAFQNISSIHEGRIFSKIDVFNGGLSYEQPFGNGFYLGADIDFYYNPNLVAYDPAAYNSTTPTKVSKSFNYSFGVYLRINPSILLKKKIF